MKLLFTSYGIGTESFAWDYFYRMPPVSLESFGSQFMPDYPVLLLFDEFIIDTYTIEHIHNKKYESYYKKMADLIDALKVSGRLDIQDFDEIIKVDNEKINKSIEYDLRNIDAWASNFEESIARWQSFSEIAVSQLKKREKENRLSFEEKELLDIFERGHKGYPSKIEIEAASILSKWRRKVKHQDREQTIFLVKQYLKYINNNIYLSHKLDSIIYDWADMEPLYKKKFEVSLYDHNSDKNIDAVRQLFKIFYPNFEPKNFKSLIKALDDPKVEELRNLVKEAVSGRVKFDDKFATQTFRDVLEIEKRITSKKSLVGWLSTPLDLIPGAGTIVQKATEETIGHYLEKKERKVKEWFYLISDVCRS